MIFVMMVRERVSDDDFDLWLEMKQRKYENKENIKREKHKFFDEKWKI